MEVLDAKTVSANCNNENMEGFKMKDLNVNEVSMGYEFPLISCLNKINDFLVKKITTGYLEIESFYKVISTFVANNLTDEEQNMYLLLMQGKSNWSTRYEEYIISLTLEPIIKFLKDDPNVELRHTDKKLIVIGSKEKIKKKFDSENIYDETKLGVFVSRLTEAKMKADAEILIEAGYIIPTKINMNTLDVIKFDYVLMGNRECQCEINSKKGTVTITNKVYINYLRTDNKKKVIDKMRQEYSKNNSFMLPKGYNGRFEADVICSGTYKYNKISEIDDFLEKEVAIVSRMCALIDEMLRVQYAKSISDKKNFY